MDWVLLGNAGSVSGGFFAKTSAGGSGGQFGSSIQPVSGRLFSVPSNTGGGLYGKNTASGIEKVDQSAGSGGLFVGPGSFLLVEVFRFLFFPTNRKQAKV